MKNEVLSGFEKKTKPRFQILIKWVLKSYCVYYVLPAPMKLFNYYNTINENKEKKRKDKLS